MRPELVSILITTHNRADLLNEVLSRLTSMFSDELRHETAELCIFDDASTDGTPAVCARYADHIRHWRVETSVGYMEARRRLFSNARGEYLVQLDNDSCFLDGTALIQLRSIFQAYPRCAAIAANIASPVNRGGLVAQTAAPVQVHQFIGCGCAFRAQLVKFLGGYPLFLSRYGGEEVALSLNVLNSGHDVLLAPQLRVYHHIDVTERNVIAQRAASLINELSILAALYPAWLVLPVSGYKIASWLRFNYKHGSLVATGPAMRALPADLVRALRYRQAVQTKTVYHFYRLRGAYARMSAEWYRASNQDYWHEIDGMFAL